MRRKLKALFFVSQLHRLVPCGLLEFIYWSSLLARWISRNKKTGYNDFYILKHDYQKRYDLYQYLVQNCMCGSNYPIDYYEFGVSEGPSFRWWQVNNGNPDSRFFGFDTFAGLPEAWGRFRKGDMKSDIPGIDNTRCHFYKGLFQNTLPRFLRHQHIRKFRNQRKGNRKIIHMDADLFSSTIFVLMTLAPYLRTGDIIIFDEFNVPLHEFKAFYIWQSFVRYKVICSFNNFHQLAIVIS